MYVFSGLSSFDLLYLTIGIAIFGLPALSTFYSDLIVPFIMPIGFPIGHIGRVGSVFVTMSVTIERYFAIVHPLKHFSGKRYLFLISIVTTILYNIQKFFEFQRTQVTETISKVIYLFIYEINVRHKNSI